MQRHPSLDQLRGEADALDLEAARIEQALSAGTPPNDVAAMALARGADRVGPMIHEEEVTLSAALREHDPNQEAWRAERAARDSIMVDYEQLQGDLAAGQDCSHDLQALATDLHRYAAIERNEVADIAEAAGDRVLREADRRVRAYGQAEADFACDLDAAWR